MKWLVLVLCLFASAAQAQIVQFSGAGGASSSCLAPTLGSLTCDANGWTQFSPGTSPTAGQFVEGHTACTGAATTVTCIIYVSTSGNDANDGTFSSPVATPIQALTLVRDGSPDWILLKCGDTWTDSGGSTNNAFGAMNVGGPNASAPFLVSSYDSGAAHNPPVPDPTTCSASPSIQVSSTWVNGPHGTAVLIPFKNNTAVVGLDLYAYKRDPANGAYLLAEAQVNTPGTGSGRALSNILFEDTTVRFFVSTMSMTSQTTVGCCGGTSGNYNKLTNMYLRRNRLISGFPSAAFADQGVLIGTIFNGPTGYVIYQNLLDHNGWNADDSITWTSGAFAGRSHNLYSSQTAVNGDAAAVGTAATIIGNVTTNDQGATLYEFGGTVKNNLCIASPFCFVVQPLTNINHVFDGNVAITPDNLGANNNQANSFASGMGPFYRPYLGVPLSFAVTNNIIANAGTDPTSIGFLFDHSLTNMSASGNIVYNWSRTNTSQAFVFTNGGAVTQHPSTQGSGYTDITASIQAAQSSNTGGNVDGQDYIVVRTDTTAGMPLFWGTVMFKKTGGSIQGPYSAATIATLFTGNASGTNLTISNVTGFIEVGDLLVDNGSGHIPANTTILSQSSGTTGGAGVYVTSNATTLVPGDGPISMNPNHVIEIYGTNYTAFGGTTFTGTIYFPWYQVQTVNTTPTSHCSTLPVMDIISVGGQILNVTTQGGDDLSSINDEVGVGCQAGDVLTATPGSACGNPAGICAHGWSWNGSSNTGSGLVITLDSVGTNTVATIDTSTSCTYPAHNVVDTGGTNYCGFPDPNRTPGSYYATLSGSTANATFTGSIDSAGVLHVTAMTSGTLNLNDAITWSGQTKADFIKGNSTISNTLCVPGTGAANCTGTGSNAPATYALTGINTSVGSTTMSSFTNQQLINKLRTRTKQTWDAAHLSTCAINKYLKAGFGITDPCNVNQ